MGETIRILIVDDHHLVREGLRMLIGTEPGMEVVGEAPNGFEALEKARLLNPDIVLVDLVMPGKDGIATIADIKREMPGTRSIVLTGFAEQEKVIPAMRAGALGYLLKDSSPHELLAAIHDVFRGNASLHPSIARNLIKELRETPDSPTSGPALTERELEILGLVARGHSNQQIADQLVLSERTVRSHVSNILGKLCLKSRTQAALYAIERGLAPLDAS